MQNHTCTMIMDATDRVSMSQAKNVICWDFRTMCPFSPSFNPEVGFTGTLQEGEKRNMKRKENSTVSCNAFVIGMKFILVSTDYEQVIFLIFIPILMNIWSPKSSVHCYRVERFSSQPWKAILAHQSLPTVLTRANYNLELHFC